jgi:hypothetical protein
MKMMSIRINRCYLLEGMFGLNRKLEGLLKSARFNPGQRVRATRHASSSAIDMTQPHLWFSKARSMKRKVVCHTGPTNSGKTFEALQRLKAARRGVYSGPLRLLAWEVCNTLRRGGIKCDLVTGQERDFEEASGHVSCTVEMTDLSEHYDVAVIDEFQLIGDQERGWAWSRAFLGLQADELHLCGMFIEGYILFYLQCHSNDPCRMPLLRGTRTGSLHAHRGRSRGQAVRSAVASSRL